MELFEHPTACTRSITPEIRAGSSTGIRARAPLQQSQVRVLFPNHMRECKRTYFNYLSTGVAVNLLALWGYCRLAKVSNKVPFNYLRRPFARL